MSWKRLFLTKKIIYRNEVSNGDEESMDKKEKGTAKEIIIESFKIMKEEPGNVVFLIIYRCPGVCHRLWHCK